ncbi:hypothetical protein TGMAS_413990 [Toxoplasma gondii MAS]|uniref:Uncharacterized protein n=1 Tax=Toxoplasma gondii MAS TaxID=943118 RepID=A0A086QRS1_TOXGO|nr:hypothetical protein TGMAS_413990 [Toxoplasma gondii MAS]
MVGFAASAESAGSRHGSPALSRTAAACTDSQSFLVCLLTCSSRPSRTARSFVVENSQNWILNARRSKRQTPTTLTPAPTFLPLSGFPNSTAQSTSSKSTSFTSGDKSEASPEADAPPREKLENIFRDREEKERRKRGEEARRTRGGLSSSRREQVDSRSDRERGTSEADNGRDSSEPRRTRPENRPVALEAEPAAGRCSASSRRKEERREKKLQKETLAKCRE